MARTKAADHHLKVEEILTSAGAAFARDGFASASMNSIAKACKASKARLYHYYQSKEAILFDLLDRYTRRLIQRIDEVQTEARRLNLSERETFGLLLHRFLVEYEHARHEHIALINDVKFLPTEQREQVVNQERIVVAAFAGQLRRAFPDTVSADNQTPLTMMVFGMINWTFTWLKPGGALSYSDFAQLVISTLEHGLASGRPTQR
jgi:AcrR family transcriptional regulator